MFLKTKLVKISKFLYFVLLFILPINLGKHFEIFDSYVGGVLVDYLVPTVFVQDILVVLIIFFWILSGGLKRVLCERDLLKKRHVQYFTLFVFSLFLSTLNSARFVPSIYAWLRLFLYSLLFIYSLVEIPIETYFFKILNIFSLSLLLVSILGIAQFVQKGSVFDNYLVFGEQPYSSATYGVPKESFFGKGVVPSYGLFRHPNIFGGYLSIVLVWVFSFLKNRKFYWIPFLFGCVALLFTFSKISWAVFLFGVFLHILFVKDPGKIKNRKKKAVFLVYFAVVLSLLLPLSSCLTDTENKSISRRANLVAASYKMIENNFLFGVGFNNSTIFIDEYNYAGTDLRFSQPVHNIFLLLFSEGGVFSLIFFALLIRECARNFMNSSYFHIYLISFLQILLLGSFDHYFITIHQTLLLFWIVLGLGLQ